MEDSVAAYTAQRFLGHVVIERSNMFIVGNPYFLLRAERDEGHNRSWQPTFEDAITRIERERVAAIPAFMKRGGAPVGLVFDGFPEGRYDVHGAFDDAGNITEVRVSLVTPPTAGSASHDAERGTV